MVAVVKSGLAVAINLFAFKNLFWFSTCLAGMTFRVDLLGVTSVVWSLGLKETCYDRILDFFHSKALNLENLTRT